VLSVRLDAPPDWMTRGACLGVEPDLFYPDKSDSGNAAKRICRACPVVSDCLAYALRIDTAHGIWGGLGARERQQINARQVRAKRADHEEPPHGTAAGYQFHQRHRTPTCPECRAAQSTYVTERRIASRQPTLHRRAGKAPTT